MNNQGKFVTTLRSRNGLHVGMLLGCTALAGIAPSAAFAQEDTGTTDLVLPSLTIQGQAGDDDRNSIVARQTTAGGKMETPILDTPASVSVVTSKEIERRDAQTTEEVLQYTPGVVTDFYGSDNRFDIFKIRGLDAYTYRDGLVIGAPFGGVREEPYAFERVEVLKGANSTAFGVGDPGGSVNYVTKTPRSEKFGEVFITGGSFNRGEIGADFGDNLTEDDTLSYRLTGKLRLSDDEYDYSQDDLGFFMGGVTWRPSEDTNLTVVYDHLGTDRTPNSAGYPVGVDFDRDVFLGEPDFNYAHLDRDTLNVMFDHDFGSGLTFSSNARYTTSESDYGYFYISSTPTDGSTFAPRGYIANDSERENFIIDGRLQYDASLGIIDSRTLVGVEHNSDSSTSRSYYEDSSTPGSSIDGIDWTNPVYSGGPDTLSQYAGTDYEANTNSVYVQQDLTFDDRLIATVGLRNDWLDLEQTNDLTGVTTDADLSELTRRAALTYKFTPEISTYISYAELVVPNGLTVEPERGDQWEVGVKYQPEAFPALFTASLYDLSKTNITRTDPVTLQPETIGEVRVRGFDLEAKAEVLENLSITAGYSYMMSDIVENGTSGNEGNELSFVPNQLASLWVDYTVPSIGTLGEMTFGLGARYTGEYFFDDANTQTGDSAILFDAAFNYELQENTDLQLNVSNIFDEKHVTYGGFGADFYNPGRTFTATLKHSW